MFWKNLKLIEQLKFNGITVYSDLFFQPPWIPLTQLTQSTSTIRIGVASVNPFVTHPIDIAGNIALLDELSNGRTYLGLCYDGNYFDQFLISILY